MMLNWEKVKVRLNCAGWSRWPRGVTVAPWYRKEEQRNDHTLVQFNAGRGRVCRKTGDVEIRPGVCLWMRMGCGYDIRQDPRRPLAMSFLHFDLLTPQGQLIPPSPPLPPEVLQPTNPKQTEMLAFRIVELIHGKSEGYAWVPAEPTVRQTATALLTALLMDLDYSAAARPVLVGVRMPQTKRQRWQSERIMSLTNELMEMEGKIPTVGELAHRAGYSREHFSRLFPEIIGFGPRQFLIRVRIGRASHLLLNSSLSIGEIADALGYKDIYHFSKQFRQQTGQTASAFRKRGGFEPQMNTDEHR